MKVLSLFDGMSCGMIAMLSAGVEVGRYVAYEIDKYAVKTSQHNFPMVEQMGDVFKADFTQYQGFDFLVGGSPCTYWSIAQTSNRETEASGLGWELFSQYVRALRESKPKYFIYENNKSMAKAIRDNIRETFGFEEICINSALVSAQNRQRYYWVGKYNPETGWYDKVEVEQPEDRGILLKDVLAESATPIKIAPYTIMKGHEMKFHDHKVRQGDDGGSMQGTYIYVDGDCKTNSVIAGHAGDEKVLFSLDDTSIHLTSQIFEIRNGFVNILGLSVPTSFPDGLYGIRYLSVREIQKLQTVPEWYDFSCVSNTQAYKMLGNGWTCEVIAHLIRACISDWTRNLLNI